jgi:hypothetical protein
MKTNRPLSATDLQNMEVEEFILRSIYASKDNPADQPIIQEMYRRDKIGTAYLFGDVETLLQELSHDNISAAEHLGMLYELGNEQYGIYIDKARAQSYYDMLGYNPMDGLSEEDLMPESEPAIVTYQLSGNANDLKAIEQMIQYLAKDYGTPNGELNAPVQGLMKVLVGSDAYEYRGNILSMTYMDEQTLHIQAEVRRIHAMQYAISQCFSNVRVEIIKE